MRAEHKFSVKRMVAVACGYAGDARLFAIYRDHLCALIRKHRYDVLGTGEPYRVITNGYGHFMYVELIEDGTRIGSAVIKFKLLELARAGKLSYEKIETKVFEFEE